MCGETVGTWVNKGMYHVSNLFEYWEFGNLLMKNQNRKNNGKFMCIDKLCLLL